MSVEGVLAAGQGSDRGQKGSLPERGLCVLQGFSLLDRGQTGVRQRSDRGQTGSDRVRQGSDRVRQGQKGPLPERGLCVCCRGSRCWTGVRQGSDRGQTGSDRGRRAPSLSGDCVCVAGVLPAGQGSEGLPNLLLFF